MSAGTAWETDPRAEPQPRDLLTSSTSIRVVSAACGHHCTQHGDTHPSTRPLEGQALRSDLPGASGAVSDGGRRSGESLRNSSVGSATRTTLTAKDTATGTAAWEPHSLHSRRLRFLPGCVLTSDLTHTTHQLADTRWRLPGGRPRPQPRPRAESQPPGPAWGALPRRRKTCGFAHKDASEKGFPRMSAESHQQAGGRREGRPRAARQEGSLETRGAAVGSPRRRRPAEEAQR